MKKPHLISKNPLFNQKIWLWFYNNTSIAIQRLNWMRDELIQRAKPPSGWYLLQRINITIYKDLTIIAVVHYITDKGYWENVEHDIKVAQDSWYFNGETWQSLTDKLFDSFPDQDYIIFEANPWDSNFKQHYKSPII